MSYKIINPLVCLMFGLVVQASIAKDEFKEAESKSAEIQGAIANTINKVQSGAATQYYNNNDILQKQKIDESLNRAGKAQESGEISDKLSFAIQKGKVDMDALQDQVNALRDVKMAESRKKDVYIFISLSMPRTSLDRILQDANKAGIPVLIRGVSSDGFEATLAEIQKIKTDTPDIGDIQIDPILFDAYRVGRVPAFVVTDGSGFSRKSCAKSEVCIADDQSYDIAYGDVTVEYALRYFSRISTVKAVQMQPFLEKLDNE